MMSLGFGIRFRKLWLSVLCCVFVFVSCSGKNDQSVRTSALGQAETLRRVTDQSRKQTVRPVGALKSIRNDRSYGHLAPPDLAGTLTKIDRKNLVLSPRITDRVLPSGRYFDHAYPTEDVLAAACVRGVDLFDISDEKAIILRHSVDTPGHAWSVAVVDGSLWVADGYAGITVVDPVTASVTARWPAFENVRYIYPSPGGWTAICRHRKGVDIVQAQKTGPPRVLSHLDVGERVFYCFSRNTVLYLGTMDAGYIAVDMKDPHHPEEIWRFAGPDRIVWCSKRRGYHILADRAKGVWSLRDRGDKPPVKIDFLPMGKDITRRGVFLDDGTLLLAQKSGIGIVSLTKSGELTMTAHVPADNEGRGISFHAGDIFFSDGDLGLKRYSVDSGKAMICRSRYDHECLLTDVVSSGNWIYATHTRGGLEVCRVNDEGKLVSVGTVRRLNYPCAVDIEGSLLAVADYSGLKLYDVSRPESLQELGRIKTPGRASGVRLKGKYAYVADWFEGVEIISVSDPGHPVITASVPVDGWAIDLAAADDYLYVCCVNNGLLTVDVSKPQAPEVTQRYTHIIAPEGLCVTDTALYIVDFNAGLIVFNRRDPAHPKAVSYIDMKVCKGVEISGDLLVVSNYIYGIRFFDISDAFAPVLIGSLDTPGKAYETSFLPADRSMVEADWHGLLRVTW